MKSRSRSDDEFHLVLGHWYKEHKRDLPWRNTRDPYRVWLSEIILQQTRVNQGLEYYLRFIDLFPSVEALAGASEEQVLKAWQGLGYYSRARNLHHSAQTIVRELGGVFPKTYGDIKKLRGIGPYTAAAIASFCFDEAEPVMDGNVIRFLSRLTGQTHPVDTALGLKKLHSYAQSIIPSKSPGEFNQAIMEFGALHCTPSTPQCSGCPFEHRCEARRLGLQAELPVKSKKNTVKDVWYFYAVIQVGNDVMLRKRTGSGIWTHLFDFPAIESDKNIPVKKLAGLLSEAGWLAENSVLQHISGEFIHLLSHRRIHAYFLTIESSYPPKAISDDVFRVSTNNLSQFAFPRLIEKYLMGRNMLLLPSP